MSEDCQSTNFAKWEIKTIPSIITTILILKMGKGRSLNKIKILKNSNWTKKKKKEEEKNGNWATLGKH